jgi:hypothetical protein
MKPRFHSRVAHRVWRAFVAAGGRWSAAASARTATHTVGKLGCSTAHPRIVLRVKALFAGNVRRISSVVETIAPSKATNAFHTLSLTRPRHTLFAIRPRHLALLQGGALEHPIVVSIDAPPRAIVETIVAKLGISS